ncbi:BTAD domain-containing putative transcriptional regulator [soil metagenome]
MIHFRLLGSLELKDTQNRDLDEVLAQHKRVALLAYLVLARGFHRRDTAVAYLWPDQDHTHARKSLRQALYFLRQQLGEEVILTRGKEEIGFDLQAIRCDALDLERAFQAGNMRRVLELYHGELLPGFHVSNVAAEFEHWLDGERFRARHRAQEAASRLADAHERAGEFREAARRVRQGLLLEPTDERAIRRLMSLMERCGDRSGAMREYEGFRKRLHDEWGIATSEETRALASEFRREEPTEPPPRRSRGLPRPSSPLVGRRKEAEEVAQLLKGSARLVTLTGAGGSGKTRLAIEVATQLQEHYPGGAIFVPLAPVRNAEGVLRALGRALETKEVPGRPLIQQVKNALMDVEALLVMDNFEHVLGAAAWMEDILAWTPVDLLVTSRIPLRTSGEREFRIPPLTLPDPDRLLGTEPSLDSEAVALFVERASGVDPDFRLTHANVRHVIKICRRLDGLPLAIELAAARMNVLPVAEIAGRLDRPFALLTYGPRHVPARHRTLEAAIRWSCDLLGPKERELFYGLSVFRGGCSLDAVEALWSWDDLPAIDALSLLLDSSLVQREDDPQGNPRYILLETIRQYAARELEKAGKMKDCQRRHAEHFAAWTTEGMRFYCTVAEASWLKRLDMDYENLCTALEWSIGHHEGETAGKLASSIWWFWWVRGYAAEGRRWIDRVLREAGDIPGPCRARCLLGSGALASAQGDHEAAIAAAREGLALARKSGDRAAEACALQNLGFACREYGDLDSAEAAFQQVLQVATMLEDESRTAVALFSLGSIARTRRDYGAAIPLLRESQALSERVGNRGRMAHAMVELGRIAGETGDLKQAESLLQDSLETFETLGQKADIGEALERLGEIASGRGEEARAQSLRARSLEIYSDVDYRPGFVRTLVFFAESASMQGRGERAAQLLGGVENEIQARPGSIAPEIHSRLQGVLGSLREQLGPALLEVFLASGRALSREQLVALATEKAQELEFKLASR